MASCMRDCHEADNKNYTINEADKMAKKPKQKRQQDHRLIKEK
jgi:hypothetical protein